MVGRTRILSEYYHRNGMRSFPLRIRIKDGGYLSLADKRVELVLYNSQSLQTYKWSSTETEPEKLLLLEENGDTGKITFPEIKQWDIPVGLHTGDLEVYDSDGFLLTYRTLEFNIVENFKRPA